MLNAPERYLSELKKRVTQHPDQPPYYNALAAVYGLIDQERKRKDLIRQIREKFPDYVLGIYQLILDETDLDRLLSLGYKLGPNLSINDWLHDMEEGHNIHNFVQFELCAARFLYASGQFEAADERLGRLLELGVEEESLKPQLRFGVYVQTQK